MTDVTDHSWSPWWCDLPADVLNRIAEYLPMLSKLNSGMYARVGDQISTPSKHLAYKSPWVMSYREETEENYNGWFLHPFHSRSLFYLYDPSQKRKYTLVNEVVVVLRSMPANMAGCFSQRKKHLFFYTPFAHKIIHLPENHEYLCSNNAATFSASPTSPDCVVFVISTVHSDHHKLYLSTSRPGERTWSNFSFDGDYGEIESLAFVGGVFYCLFSDGVMGSFKVEQQEWKIIHPKTTTTDATNHRCLIESRDDSNLFMTYNNELSPILRYDQSENKWFEVGNLDNRMLFLGVTSMLLSTSSRRGATDL
ncbi:hypothetical protein Dsin_032577 [Dipteronia sinensis]|uniref:KIB1-4 beta-propeller domain-containing protein n=1 Tax=Dipteronia sinensis TaxID=43782 RepID=A0AAD9Z754_9ROSI|nr:hypothetical protein Dsin_032577 [Dipteronia sinensis]